MTQGGPTQSWKEEELVEVMLSSGKEERRKKQREKTRETGRRWREKEQNSVLVCKWPVSLDVQSLLSLVIVTPIVN